ncbi:MAG: hypothetical protein KDA95_00635 [Acidimicrobiales bacterium]|nr:hypothetical protein [Acidimicrobiales bacterium]
MHTRLLIAGSLAVAALLSFASPASADATIRVSPSSGLNPKGAFVSVTGSGFPANTQLFVMQCIASSGEDHTCNSVGLRKVTTDANGNFSANAMRVVARFGAIDCTRSACEVKTSAVSGHSGDRSLDKSARISFSAPTVTTTAPPPTTAPPVTIPPTIPLPQTTTTAATRPTTTVANSATTTTVSKNPTTTVVGSGSTTIAQDSDQADSNDADNNTDSPTESDATSTVTDDDSDSGSNTTTALAVGGVAIVGIAGTVGLVLVRRRNAQQQD